MEAGTAREAALRTARLRAGLSHWVRGALQHVQGRTPEMGALRTPDQWFVFFYIHTDSFLYLILVSMSAWSVCLMGHSSLLLSPILHMGTCVHCRAASPLSLCFYLFHPLLASDYNTLGLWIEGESPDGAPQILSSE